MTAGHRDESAALFAELRDVLSQIRQTEAAASLDQLPSAGASMTDLLASLQTLRDRCAAHARLYQHATALLDQQIELWAPA